MGLNKGETYDLAISGSTTVICEVTAIIPNSCGKCYWFSRDDNGTMLVYRTIAKKKSLGNLILLLCKSSVPFCPCFVDQHGHLFT